MLTSGCVYTAKIIPKIKEAEQQAHWYRELDMHEEAEAALKNANSQVNNNTTVVSSLLSFSFSLLSLFLFSFLSFTLTHSFVFSFFFSSKNPPSRLVPSSCWKMLYSFPPRWHVLSFFCTFFFIEISLSKPSFSIDSLASRRFTTSTCIVACL